MREGGKEGRRERVGEMDEGNEAIIEEVKTLLKMEHTCCYWQGRKSQSVWLIAPGSRKGCSSSLNFL